MYQGSSLNVYETPITKLSKDANLHRINQRSFKETQPYILRKVKNDMLTTNTIENSSNWSKYSKLIVSKDVESLNLEDNPMLSKIPTNLMTLVAFLNTRKIVTFIYSMRSSHTMSLVIPPNSWNHSSPMWLVQLDYPMSLIRPSSTNKDERSMQSQTSEATSPLNSHTKQWSEVA